MVHRNKPMLGGSVEPWLDAQVKRWARHSGLSVARILCEIIQFAINHGYRPGSVSVADLRQDARNALRKEGDFEEFRR